MKKLSGSIFLIVMLYLPIKSVSTTSVDDLDLTVWSELEARQELTQSQATSRALTGIPQASMELNFEESSGTTAYDASFNNNSGALHGGVFYTSDHAVGSYALSFDGINGRVACGSDSSLRPNDISVSLWVKHIRDTTTNYGGIIQSPHGYGYTNGFRILDYKNQPLGQINFGDADPVPIFGQAFIVNEWSHIVLTYDHLDIRLYQNGRLVAEKPETRNINVYSG